jgi:hypothetical protein
MRLRRGSPEMVNNAKTYVPLARAHFLKNGARVEKIKKSKFRNFTRPLVNRLSGLPCLSTLTGMKRTTTAREPRPRRKQKPIVYGSGWGAWIKRNVERDLRSGALRVNAEGATIH